MQAFKLAENIYWVGAIDWNLRNFHGYETEKGSTYNAYLILDEKVTLIDTVKEGFGEEMLARFVNEWIPLENHYLDATHLEARCDMIWRTQPGEALTAFVQEG